MKASSKFMAGSLLNEAMRRARSPYAHQRSFAQWCLNVAIKHTQAAIAEHIESKQPKRQLGQIGLSQ